MNLLLRLSRVYLKPHRYTFTLVLLAAMLSSLSPFTLAYLSKIMVDDVLAVGTPGEALTGPEGRAASGVRLSREGSAARDNRGAQRTEGSSTRRELAPDGSRAGRIQMLWIVFGAYVALRMAFAGLQWGSTYGISRIGQEIVFHLRRDVYQKLQSLQVSYFDRFQTGRIMSRVMDDVNVVQFSVAGIFVAFLEDKDVKLVGVEAAGFGIETGKHAASILAGNTKYPASHPQ